jgi:uncharacterized sporulation protein YeaH/YhbH (DUF444 family)
LSISKFTIRREFAGEKSLFFSIKDQEDILPDDREKIKKNLEEAITKNSLISDPKKYYQDLEVKISSIPDAGEGLYLKKDVEKCK